MMMTNNAAMAANSAPKTPPSAPTAPAANAETHWVQSEFGTDMLAALQANPRSISPKYFYDAKGSQLFDQICDLPEYYPTRTEISILERHAGSIAERIGPNADIVEFGAGSLRKVRLLLDALHQPHRYLPIDISGEHLAASAATLRQDYPGLEVTPITADYTRRLLLPAQKPGGGQRVGFFPGSTIGNFTPIEALHFLETAAQVLRGGALLLGADLLKDPAVLHAAYNDAQGVTAAFNLNLLARANSELGTDFDLDAFSHHAFFNPGRQRIEMHLASKRRQTVSLCKYRFEFLPGQTLHTENSYKFSIDGLRELAAKAGFTPGPVWTDPQQLFSLHWLQAPK